ncbi:MAG: IclR family transcriptional regulator [Pseudomonadota bacterium]
MVHETPPRVDSTLSKGLAILEKLTTLKAGMGVSELSRELGLTKSNTFRLLQTLTALDYVRREPDKSYSATLKTWQVGRSVVENLNLRAAASQMMLYLSEATKETIYLAVRDGLNVVYIDKIESTKPIRSWNPIGGTAPIHCVGTGKAILAAEYRLLREHLSAPFERFTDKTITDFDTLDAVMAETRLRGYAEDTGEFRQNILSFGAAISLPNGETVGALGVSVPDVNLQEGDNDRIGAHVQHAARAVSESLGRL